MKRNVLVVLAMAGLAFAPAAHAQFARGIGTIEGTVVDSHGRPVRDASVTIQTSDGLRPHATHTDSAGHYEFTRFDAGQYDLRAYSNGEFSDWSKHVLLRPKKTTEITLRLPPDSDEKVKVTTTAK
jgi:Ni/Co efflux regulator RcnB